MFPIIVNEDGTDAIPEILVSCGVRDGILDIIEEILYVLSRPFVRTLVIGYLQIVSVKQCLYVCG